MENKRIDCYIEPKMEAGVIKEYTMYFEYNNIEASFLYRSAEAMSFANHFCHKVRNNIIGALYTDEKGWAKEYDLDAFLACVSGLENIKRCIHDIVSGCENKDINADLFFHFNDKVFNLVSDSKNDKNEKEYNIDTYLEFSDELDVMIENLNSTDINKKMKY